MQENDSSRRRKFYDQMSEAYDLGSYEEFDSKMNNADSRKKLFDFIDKDGKYDIGDFDYFDKAMQPVGQEEQTVTSQEPQMPSVQGNGQPTDALGNPLDHNGQPYSQAVLDRYNSPDNQPPHFKDLSQIAGEMDREQMDPTDPALDEGAKIGAGMIAQMLQQKQADEEVARHNDEFWSQDPTLQQRKQWNARNANLLDPTIPRDQRSVFQKENRQNLLDASNPRYLNIIKNNEAVEAGMKAFDKAMKEAEEKGRQSIADALKDESVLSSFAGGLSPDGSMTNHIPAIRKANEIADPQKAIDKAVNDATAEMLKDEHFSTDGKTLNKAGQYAIEEMQQRMVQQLVDARVPKSTAEYVVLTAIKNSDIGKLTRMATNTAYENWLDDVAASQYDAGFWEKVANGALTFGMNLPEYLGTGVAGGAVSKKILGEFTKRTANELVKRGVQKATAERAAQMVVNNSLSGTAAKLGASSAAGATTFGLQPIVGEPIDITYQAGQPGFIPGSINTPGLSDYLTKTLKEMGKGTAMGALMIGGAAANTVGKIAEGKIKEGLARGLAGLAYDSSVMSYFGLQDMKEQDPNFEITPQTAAESFAESAASLMLLKAPHMFSMKGKVKDAKEFNRKFNFTPEDREVLKSMGIENPLEMVEKLAYKGATSETINKAKGDVTLPSADGIQSIDAEDMQQLTNQYRSFMASDAPETLKAKAQYLIEGKMPQQLSSPVEARVTERNGNVYLETINENGGVIESRKMKDLLTAEKERMQMNYDIDMNKTAAMELRLNEQEVVSDFAENLSKEYEQARVKSLSGEELTDADRQAIYLYQNFDKLQTALEKQAAGTELLPEEQAIVNAMNGRTKAYVNRDNASKKVAREIEKTHGMNEGELQQAIMGHSKAEAEKLAESTGEPIYEVGNGTYRTEFEDNLVNEYRNALLERINKNEANKNAEIVKGAAEEATQQDVTPRLTSQDDTSGGEPPVPPTRTSADESGTGTPTSGTGGGGSVPENADMGTGGQVPELTERREAAYNRGAAIADNEGDLTAIGQEERLATARMMQQMPDNDPQAARIRNSVMQAVMDGNDEEADQIIEKAINNAQLNPQQVEAIEQWRDAMETQLGIEDAVASQTDQFEQQRREELETIADPQGNVTQLQLKNGQTVYYKSGDLDNHFGGVFAVDENGKPVQVPVRDIANVSAPMSADEIITNEIEAFADNLAARYQGLSDGSVLDNGQQVDMVVSGQPFTATVIGTDPAGNIIFQLEDGSQMPMHPADAQEAIMEAEGARIQQTLQVEAESARLAEQQKRFANGIAGFTEGQPDLTAAVTDPKAAAEYIATQFGADGSDPEKARKQYVTDIQNTKEQLKIRQAEAAQELNRLNQWLSGNEDIADANEVQQTKQRIADLQAAIADIETRQQKWGEIRQQLMTKEEQNAMEQQRRKDIFKARTGYQPQLPQRNISTDEERITIEDGKPNFGLTSVANANNYLLKHFKQSPEAEQFINEQRLALRNRQRDEIQPEINRRNDLLNAYAQGLVELSPDEVTRLTHEIADLEALQDGLSQEAVRLREIAEGITALYERNGREEELTPAEKRGKLLENVTSREDKLSRARNIYKVYPEALDVINDQEPRDLDEFIAENLGLGSMSWEGFEIGDRHIVGVQEAVFGKKGATRGIGKGYSTNAFNQYLAKTGEGKGFDEIVHAIYESQPDIGDGKRWTTEEISDGLINLLRTAQKPSDISHRLIDNRIAEAEAIMQRQEDLEREAEEEVKYQELQEWADAYHLTPEEVETYQDYLNEKPWEFDEEVINQIIADDEQNQRSKEVDSQHPDGSVGVQGEGGEGEIRQSGATEGTTKNTPVEGEPRAEGGAGGETLPDNNVPGGEQIQGLEGYTEKDVTDLVRQHFEDVAGDTGARIVDIKVIGSRANGTANDDSDIDALLEYEGDMNEDGLFNILNDEENRLFIEGIPVDINPITKGKSGSIAEFLERNKDYKKEDNSFPARLAEAKAETDTNPTEAQKKAGNYKMGHISFGGYDYSIENPKGSTRSGVDKNGKPWSIEMQDTYGYILRKIGVDGDHLDMFINDDADLDTFDGRVYVVDQKNEDGTFDEHKVMYGYPNWSAAKKAYERNYEPGWWDKHVMQMTGVKKADFDKWLDDSDHKTKPFADYYRTKMTETVNSPADQLMADIADRQTVAAQRDEQAEELRRIAERLQNEPTTGDNAVSHLSDAYILGDKDAIRDVADRIREIVKSDEEIMMDDNIDPDWLENYDGENPDLLAQKYIVRLSRHYFTDYDDDIPYIVTGIESSEGRPKVPESIRYEVESFLVNDRKLAKGELNGEELTRAMGKQNEMAKKIQPLLARLSDKQLEQTIQALEDFPDTAPVIAVQMEQERRSEKQDAVDKVMAEVEQRKAQNMMPVQTSISETDMQYMDDDQLVQRRHKAKADLMTSADLLAANNRLKPGGPKYEQLMKNILQAEADVNAIDEELERRANFDQYEYQIENGIVSEPTAEPVVRELSTKAVIKVLDDAKVPIKQVSQQEADDMMSLYTSMNQKAIADYARSMRPNDRKRYAVINVRDAYAVPMYFEKKSYAEEYRVWGNRAGGLFKTFDLDSEKQPFADEQLKKAAEISRNTEFLIDDGATPYYPTFYSNAMKAVESIKQDKATPEQWLKMIEKGGGLKAGEDKWIGLSDWLKEQQSSGKKSITKQEVEDYIRKNQIEILDVNYADAIDTMTKALEREMPGFSEAFMFDTTSWGDVGARIIDKEKAVELFNEYNEDNKMDPNDIDKYDLGEIEEWVVDKASNTRPNIFEKSINDTRLSYTTQGLDHNKEIALVVPTIEPYNESDQIHFGDAGGGRAVAWVRFGETTIPAANIEELRKADAEALKALNEYTSKMAKKYQSLMKPLQQVMTEKELAEYKRLGDACIEADYALKEAERQGRKRVLVIDEIQSKRHQDARGKGYGSLGDAERLFRAADNALYDYRHSMHAKYPQMRNISQLKDYGTPEEIAKHQQLDEEFNDLYKKFREAKALVPAAPFEKNWHELAMKRMLRYAAENGYDKIAWTTGEQQADRYDIGKVIDQVGKSLTFEDTGETRYDLYPKDNSGSISLFVKDGVVTKSSQENLEGKRFDEVVGKDLAAKMLEMSDDSQVDIKDLNIGGEGMKGFYDLILPRFMDKYGKKWGVKTGEIYLPDVGGDEYKKPDNEKLKGLIMHSVPVTPEMKESVMQGQPMFQKEGKGKIYGWTDGTGIFLTPLGMNPNSPMHEYTHIWDKYIQKHDPKLWKEMVATFKKTAVWKEIRENENYRSIWNDVDRMASEVHSRLTGARSQEEFEKAAAEGAKDAESIIKQVRDVLRKFWEKIASLFGYGKDRLEEFVLMPLRDVLKGFNPITGDNTFEPMAMIVQMSRINKYGLNEIDPKGKVVSEVKKQGGNSVLAGYADEKAGDYVLLGEDAKRMQSMGGKGTMTKENGMDALRMTRRQFDDASPAVVRRGYRIAIADLSAPENRLRKSMPKGEPQDTTRLKGLLKSKDNRDTSYLQTLINQQQSYIEQLRKQIPQEQKLYKAWQDAIGTKDEEKGRDRYDKYYNNHEAEIQELQQAEQYLDDLKNELAEKQQKTPAIEVKLKVDKRPPVQSLIQGELFSDMDFEPLPEKKEEEPKAKPEPVAKKTNSLEDMSDEDLLKAIGEKDGVERRGYIDLYDQRHLQEQKEENDAYYNMLDVGNTTLDDAYGMYDSVFKQFKEGGYASPERTKLLAQIDALEAYIEWQEEREAERRMEEDEEAVNKGDENIPADGNKQPENIPAPEKTEAQQKFEQQQEEIRQIGYDLTSLSLRPLEEGETSHVQRRYVENGMFSFTGAEHIKSVYDIAYIFRELEDASVENTFLTLVKDGQPTIIHLAIGGYTQSYAPYDTALAAYQEIDPEMVFFIHNHPSGNLKASRDDMNLMKALRNVFGRKLQDGIIIDTKSGKFGIFNEKSQMNEGTRPTTADNEVPLKVYSFSKSVFDEDWNPETAFRALDSKEVAAFISSHRLGEHPKMSLIVTDTAGHVTGNIFLPFTTLKEAAKTENIDLIAKYVEQMGGNRCILYGNYEYDLDDARRTTYLNEKLKSRFIRLADLVHIDHSAAEAQMIGEPDTEPIVASEPVTDSKEIERLDNEPKEVGYRNVVLNENGSLGSPMANRLGKKNVGRKATSMFEFGQWERSDENPDLATDDGKIDLIKPDGKTVDSVDYNPYIHIRPTLVNKQFKQAWERPNLVYVRTEYPTSELTSGYHADKAKLTVGKHPWNGGELILSRWDKPMEIVPWEEVADDWMKEFEGTKGIHFDIIPPKLLPILAERGITILPPHKNMGKACNEAYEAWKESDKYFDEGIKPQGDYGVMRSTGSDAAKGRFLYEGKPVDEMTGQEFGDLSIPLTESVGKYFADTWNNNVDRPSFGSVIVDKRGVKDDVAHGKLNRNRAASFHAVPYVIRDGVIIDNQEKWKGRDYDSITIAAPVTINGERFIEFAILKRLPNSNRYYLHGVVTQKNLQEEALRTGTEAALHQGDVAKILINLYNAKENAKKMQKSIKIAADETADMLGGVKVNYATGDEITDEKLKRENENGTLGMYDPNTGEVTLFLDNIEDVTEAKRTVCHEKLGHEGLVALLGDQAEVDKFGQFIFKSADKALRQRIIDKANDEDPAWKDPKRFSHAAQEVFGDIAADGPRTAEEFSLWRKVKHYLIRLLNKLGLRIRGLLNDHDLRYYVLKTGEALKRWNQMSPEEQRAAARQETDYDLMRSRRGKPRKRKDESMAQYLQRLRDWEKWKIAEEQAAANNDPMPDAEKINEKWHEKFNRDLDEWKRQNNIESDAEGLGEFPKRERGETPQEYAMRVADYEAKKDAWRDAPNVFDYLQQANEEYKQAYFEWKERYGIREAESVDLGLYEGDPDRLPHIVDPEDLEADDRADADLAEAVGVDMSSEGARRHAKLSIIDRRKNLESANAEDAIWIHNFVKRTNEIGKANDVSGKDIREALPYIIESEIYKKAKEEEKKEAIDAVNTSETFKRTHTFVTKENLDAVHPEMVAAGEAYRRWRDEPSDPQRQNEFHDAATALAERLNELNRDAQGYNNVYGDEIMSVYPLLLKASAAGGGSAMPTDMEHIKDIPGIQELLDDIKEWYDYFFHEIEDAGLRNDAGYIEEGYVNHIWDKERSDPAAWEKYVENYQRTKSPNMRTREIPTYMQGIEIGLVPKFRDIADIMAYYSVSNNEAIANKKFLDAMSFIVVEELNTDGEVVSVLPLLNSQRPNIAVSDRYTMYHVPGVGDVWVLNEVQRQFANIFGTMRTKDIPDWLSKVGKAYDVISSTAKKIELSFSAFHMGALTEVAMAQMRPDRALKALGQYIIFDCAKAGTVPAYAHPEDFKLAASHLVQLGATQDYSAADVNNVTEKLRNIVRELAKEENPAKKGAGLAATPVAYALDMINKGMDKVLWNYLHDGLKIACFKMFAEQIEQRVEKEGLSAEQREQLLDEAGQYVNDSFGGQYFELLNVSPALVKWLRRAFLSPDWLISTQRHFLANFGFGSIYSESGFLNYLRYNADNIKRAFGAKIPRNENRRFRSKNAKQCYLLGVCGFFYVMMNALNAMFRSWDEEKEKEKADEIRRDNPDYKSAYELAYPDGMKWYDYTMYGNTIGQQTHLFMGRYDDGTEWYARWGKQFREFPEMFIGRHGVEFPTPLMERMSGKANPIGRYLLYDLPLTVGMYGYKQPRETQEIVEKYGNTVALLAMTAKKFLPYSVPTQQDKEFKMFDLVMPSQKGFTRWKAVDYFKTYIQGGDMDGVMRTYNAAVMNGIDAEDCLKAAIATVKATQRKELEDGIVNLQTAMDRYDSEKNVAEKKRLRRKIVGYLAEQNYKTFTQAEAREQVENFLSGEQPTDNDINKYVELATSADVRDEYRLDMIRKQAKKFVDEVKTAEGDRQKKLEKNYEAWLDIYDIIQDANREIGKLKRQIGKEGEDDAAIMKEIRDIRREAQKDVDEVKAP